jgi:hypothetical protein
VKAVEVQNLRTTGRCARSIQHLRWRKRSYEAHKQKLPGDSNSNSEQSSADQPVIASNTTTVQQAFICSTMIIHTSPIIIRRDQTHNTQAYSTFDQHLHSPGLHWHLHTIINQTEKVRTKSMTYEVPHEQLDEPQLLLETRVSVACAEIR